MPRFYFYIYNDEVTHDEEGRELADADAAEAHAITAVRSLACESVSKGHLDLRHRIEVADVGGSVVRTVTFGDAVEVRG
jgi:hypothetical protein